MFSFDLSPPALVAGPLIFSNWEEYIISGDNENDQNYQL